MRQSNLTRRCLISKPFPLANLINQGGLFICGLCRSRHNSGRSASTCLRACGERRATNFIITETKPGVFKCPGCHREHKGTEKALECGQQCLDAFMDKVDNVTAFYGINSMTPKQPPSTTQNKNKPKHGNVKESNLKASDFELIIIDFDGELVTPEFEANTDKVEGMDPEAVAAADAFFDFLSSQ